MKVCRCSHLHLIDDVTYLGVRYLGNSAVCGRWWKGKNQGFGPACAVLDLCADGTADNRIVFWGS